MAQTQLANIYLGAPLTRKQLEKVEGHISEEAISQIHIIDGQSGEILDHIQSENIIDDNHKKDLETYLETYDATIIGGLRYDEHLEKRNRIIIFDEDYTLKEFVLFEVDKYRDTEGRKTRFYAHASYLELKKASVIHPRKFDNLTASQLGGIALDNTGWQIGLVEASGTRTIEVDSYTNPYELLKRIANEFGVELRFRVEHNGNRITARYVDLLERIGEWSGREVEFGFDLDGIRRVESQDIVTALLGLGPEQEDGTRLEVLVEDEDALQRWGRVDEHGNLHHLIEPYEIQSDRQEMTETEARQYTRTALDKRINTQVTYEANIVDLENVPGMENKQIRFGDTIRIKDTHFNPPLFLEARVYEMNRSIKYRDKKEIKLGDYTEYTEEEVTAIFNQLRNEIRKKVSMAQVREYAEPKIIESPTPPPIEQGENAKWIDTSGEIKVPHVVVGDEWVKMSPTEHDISDADRLTNGIIDVGQVPLRTSVSGARIEWDGVNGLVQYDQQGRTTSQIDIGGNARFANAFVTGRVEATEGYFGKNKRVTIGDDGLTIQRPDGAVWMQDGMVHQDYAVSGFDPHMTDLLSFSGGWEEKMSAINVFPDQFYETALAQFIDGRSADHNDIRSPSHDYTFRFQRYEFIHASRYIIFGYRVANNSVVGEHRVCVYDGNKKITRIDCDRYSGYTPIIVDLGKPTYERKSLDLRLGWARAGMDTHQYIRFRINRVFLTDYI